MTDRFDQLSPRDTAITLRSLGRRFSQATQLATRSPDLAAKVEAPGPSGDSLTGLIDGAARIQGFLLNELTRSLEHEDPVISAAVFDANQRHFVEARPVPLEAGLESLSSDSDAAGQLIQDASAKSLGRSVSVVGGSQTTPLAIGQEAARSGIDLLQRTEKQVEWLVNTTS